MRKVKLKRKTFRIPFDLSGWLEKKAVANNRSANSELITILQNNKEEEEE